VGSGDGQQRDAQPNEAFDAFVATADYPICIVTTVAGQHLVGCLVGFAGQVSIEPRRFLVALSKTNY
jgi:flavin reductase (DIM6/NTAB) family NADH-FMN oxidoreductase RutF